ncbi:MAG: hypothetical protein D6807_02200 [Alphaproteobacteria bacterium]|nr:MAG: hypothetical protein D6807_02200 [Alphaproteobacteria bacterium]
MTSLRIVAFLAIGFTLALAPVPAAAQDEAKDEAPKAPPKGCTGPGFADFDFWLGEWDVYPTAKPEQKVGHNSIKKLDGGCAIFESWRNVRGEPGHSLNYYVPDSGKWRQIWVSLPGYRIDISGGADKPGHMQLEGTILYYGRGEVPFRGTWTAQDDGSVRQVFEQYDPKAEKWGLWFDGTYRRSGKP